ncbi:MAG TPA: hypothetical protein VLQ90_14000 [Pyrinomonadaceae bacterium]|nr:hypothetical protein [Pyrinomonadaceae bacterium]
MATRKTKRVISKTKMYGFNPHTDQIDGVNQVMEETGEKSESAILRKLLDEALAARRLKAAEAALSELPFGQGFGEMLRAVQTLLAKLVRQGETSLRMQDLSLALLQETLASSLADRKTTWTLAESNLKQQGLKGRDMAEQFEAITTEANAQAYGTAQRINESQRKD